MRIFFFNPPLYMCEINCGWWVPGWHGDQQPMSLGGRVRPLTSSLASTGLVGGKQSAFSAAPCLRISRWEVAMQGEVGLFYQDRRGEGEWWGRDGGELRRSKSTTGGEGGISGSKGLESLQSWASKEFGEWSFSRDDEFCSLSCIWEC